MELAESQALKSGYDTMYLCTYDKQAFYEHLGYQYCKPVNTLGAQMLESCMCSTGGINTPLPCEDLEETCQKPKEECLPNECDVTENNDIDSNTPEPLLPVSPPPPPPPPPPPAKPAPVVYWLTKTLKVM
ncbi:hypothetical protein HOLleu_08547 [Holothuria leucospilota]|uniref:Uncharacterized protein n=1 Tax=Holothuria leucospilota TaxID=206669 RepID=A0A9Q1HDJ9_HOLLE|nr:hypothetical protein HOLleu_08547 [Holothuria leucospilota]